MKNINDLLKEAEDIANDVLRNMSVSYLKIIKGLLKEVKRLRDKEVK